MLSRVQAEDATNVLLLDCKPPLIGKALMWDGKSPKKWNLSAKRCWVQLYPSQWPAHRCLETWVILNVSHHLPVMKGHTWVREWATWKEATCFLIWDDNAVSLVPELLAHPCSTAPTPCSILFWCAYTTLNHLGWLYLCQGAEKTAREKQTKRMEKSLTKTEAKSSHATRCFQINEAN